jgi:tetratricopeptide (TPR) repeat protein
MRGSFRLCVCATLIVFILPSVHAFADEAPAPDAPPPVPDTLVGVWLRPQANAQTNATDTLSMDISSDGSVHFNLNNEPEATATGTFTLQGNHFHIAADNGQNEDGTFAQSDPNTLTLTEGGSGTVYTRRSKFMTTTPSRPLMLQTTLPSPRQFVVNRAALEAQLEPELNGSGPAQQLLRALQLCDAGQGAQALAIVNPLAGFYGEDVELDYVQGLAQLQTGDFAGARASFDGLLLIRPEVVEAYLNRGLAAGHLGSIPRMQADRAIARALDPAFAAQFEVSHKADFDALSGAAPGDNMPAMTDAMINAALGGADVPALMPLGMTLYRAVNLHRRIPEERYLDGVRVRAAEIEAHLNDPQAWANLAAYVYNDGVFKHGYGDSAIDVINDDARAMSLAREATTLDPRNPSALSSIAWMMEQDRQLKDALGIAAFGLTAAPGYPRLVHLEAIILSANSIDANSQAAAERARKFGTQFIPGWIINWSRGPNAAELAAARQFDEQSAADVNTVNGLIGTSWQRYKDSIEEMNVIASYDNYNNDPDDALALWNRILQIDPDNPATIHFLQEFYAGQRRFHEGFEMQIRMDNIFSNSVKLLNGRAEVEQKTNGRLPDAEADMQRAQSIDPTHVYNYYVLAQIALCNNHPDQVWAYLHCGEAVAIADAQMHGVDPSPQTTAPVTEQQVAALKESWTTEQQWAQEDNAADLTNHYSALLEKLNQRITPATDPKQIPEEMKLGLLRVMLANNEMEAAARRLTETRPDLGRWHQEASDAAMDVEYPLYLYLRSSRFPYQIWHYIGPDTLKAYEQYAKSHQAFDPNDPPSRIPRDMAPQ